MASGSRALACVAAVPAAAAGLPFGFAFWAILPVSGGADEIGAYFVLGVMAAILCSPILIVVVPLLAAGAEALLRRIGWRGAAAYASLGGMAGAVVGPLIVGAVETFDSSSRFLASLPPGILAGVLAALAYWAVRRPDRLAPDRVTGGAMDAFGDGR